MDHPCHKCKQSVEDGIPFCAQCGAPQIRVLLPEPLVPAMAGAGAEGQTAAEPHVLVENPPGQPIGLPVVWSRALQPCGLSAGIAFILIVLHVYPFVAIFSAGMFSVIFYRQRAIGVALTASMGARLGAISGLLCFFLCAIFGALKMLALHEQAEFRSQLLETIQQAALRANDPQAQPMLDFFKSPEGLVVLGLSGAVLALFIFVFFAGLGGTLSGAFLGRRRDRP